jgi:glutamine synthetase
MSRLHGAEPVDWPTLIGEAAQHVVLEVADVNGFLRGKVYTRSAFLRHMQSGAPAMAGGLLFFDFVDVMQYNSEFGEAGGFQDAYFAPDPSTVGIIDHPTPVARVMCDLQRADGEFLEFGSRQVLRCVMDRWRNTDLRPQAGLELECHILAQQLHGNLPHVTYDIGGALATLPYFTELTRRMNGLGVDLGCWHTEPTHLYELDSGFGDPIAVADGNARLKDVARQLGLEMGFDVSFMAKPVTGEEGASGHIHLSMLDTDGKDAFNVELDSGGKSVVLHHVIGGILAHLPDMALLYGPTINSYKRVRPGWYTPLTATWGHDDRRAAARVKRDLSGSTRIEFRRPGADVNPYLAFAALLGSAWLGVRDRIDPGPTIEQQLPDESARKLPKTFVEALQRFRASAAAAELFGDAFVRFYADSRELEIESWLNTVSEWETNRYRRMV